MWILSEKSKNFDKKNDPNQSKPNQSEPNQSKPNQSEPNQSKPNQSELNQSKPNQSNWNFLKSPRAPWSYFFLEHNFVVPSLSVGGLDSLWPNLDPVSVCSIAGAVTSPGCTSVWSVVVVQLMVSLRSGHGKLQLNVRKWPLFSCNDVNEFEMKAAQVGSVHAQTNFFVQAESFLHHQVMRKGPCELPTAVLVQTQCGRPDHTCVQKDCWHRIFTNTRLCRKFTLFSSNSEKVWTLPEVEKSRYATPEWPSIHVQAFAPRRCCETTREFYTNSVWSFYVSVWVFLHQTTPEKIKTPWLVPQCVSVVCLEYQTTGRGNCFWLGGRVKRTRVWLQRLLRPAGEKIRHQMHYLCGWTWIQGGKDPQSPREICNFARLSRLYEVCFLYFLNLALTVPHMNTNEPHQVNFLLLSAIFIQTIESFKNIWGIILILGI